LLPRTNLLVNAALFGSPNFTLPFSLRVLRVLRGEGSLRSRLAIRNAAALEQLGFVELTTERGPSARKVMRKYRNTFRDLAK